METRMMNKFFVYIYNFNKRTFEQYDVIPYLFQVYKDINKNKPSTFDEFKKFIKNESSYQYGGRCEYEIILNSWPVNDVSEKIDIYEQIMNNIDWVTIALMNKLGKFKDVKF